MESSCWFVRWLCVWISITTYKIVPRYYLIFKILKTSSPVGIDLSLWREYAELALPKIKYSPLAKVIEGNDWTVDLFPIEVGTCGYSSWLLSICLKRLGFNNKIIHKTTKSLSCISMKASFYMWLTRNSSVWSNNASLITIENANFSAAGNKNTIPPETAQVPTQHFWFYLQPTRNHRKCDQHTKHPGFFNKGNTCYTNLILQALSAIPLFWSQSA